MTTPIAHKPKRRWWIVSLLFLVAALLTGVWWIKYEALQSRLREIEEQYERHEANRPAPLTIERVNQAKLLLKNIRPEMTDEEVYTAIGLGRYFGYSDTPLVSTGGGPLERHCTSFSLTGGFGLHIFRDKTSPDEPLVGVYLGDATWLANQSQRSD